jgi:adenylate cyclase
LPDKPSIAVLPFTNMSDDPAQEYFSDGMTEDIITDLSKLAGLFVIALAPNDANAYMGLGWILLHAGRPEEAIKALEKAMRLDPLYPVHCLIFLGEAYYWLGRYEEAIAAEKKALLRNPDDLGAHARLAVFYGELRREAEARAEVAEVLRLSPNFSLEVVRQITPYKNPADLERVLTALRKAGLQ